MVWINLIDFGLVILIWMVQLIIYPSFTYYEKENLVKWHEVYTRAITVIVLPLMLGQLLLHGHQVFQYPSIISMLLMLLVLSTWLTTILIFVPLHNRIGKGEQPEVSIIKLINYNWMRTATWTLIFLLGIIF